MTATESLTREQIQATPAGRTLDTLVACRVTGFFGADGESKMIRMARNGSFDPNEEGAYIGPPFYSTEIADAWCVWDFMRQKGSSLLLNAGCEVGEPAECSWITGGKRYTYVSGKESDAAIICKTALLGVLGL